MRSEARTESRRAVESGEYDAALDFPADFADRLAAYRRDIHRRSEAHGADRLLWAVDVADIPRPTIVYTTANERSRTAMVRLSTTLDRWTEAVGRRNLELSRIPAAVVRPFEVDTSERRRATAYQGAYLWSTILPVLLVVWALTGAFYPAVDLCAGESAARWRRCSPVPPRSEIVLGKLLTVMAFSIATSMLNVLSVGVTGWLIFSRLHDFSPPPPLAPLWLTLALLPISALFGACRGPGRLRPQHEGRPILPDPALVGQPAAGRHSDGLRGRTEPGHRAVPVTGIVLLLKNVLEGSSVQVLPLCAGRAGVTLAACWLAVRWAVRPVQLGGGDVPRRRTAGPWLWLRHRCATGSARPPSAAACSAALVVLMPVSSADAVAAVRFGRFCGLARVHVATQLAFILARHS